MQWKPITLPIDSTASQQDGPVSWQGSGSRGDYVLIAVTNRDIADSAEFENNPSLNPDTIVGYLISLGTFIPPERAIRVSETGTLDWISEDEYQVPASELFVTAKAFCEYFDVEGEFPTSGTWESQAALYLDVVLGIVPSPVRRRDEEGAGMRLPDLESTPSMFSVFEDSAPEPASTSTTDYFPATPYTLVTDARADEESGHEFVLHFDPELERYSVFFFAQEQHAKQVQDEYNEFSTTKWAIVVRFDARGIDERFGVRYTDATGRVTDMSITDYRRNMEFKNEFKRGD